MKGYEANPEHPALEHIFDSVEWIPSAIPEDTDGPLPYETHRGTLRIEDGELECVQLSNGQRIISEESLFKFLAGIRTK